MTEGTGEHEQIEPGWWASALAAREDDDLAVCGWVTPELAHFELRALANASPPDTLQRRVLEVLARVTSAMLAPDDESDPFHPFAVLEDSRSVVPADLSDSELTLLTDILPMVESPLVRARVADAAWTYGSDRDRRLLEAAVEAYLEIPLDEAHWRSTGRDSWRRAVSLLKSQGKAQHARLDELVGVLEYWLLASTPQHGWLAVDVADLMHRSRRCGREVADRVPGHLVALAAANAANPRLSRHLERAARPWLILLGRETAAHASEVRIADTYEAEGTTRLAQEGGVAMAAGHFFERAIQTLTQLPRSYRVSSQLDTRIARLRVLVSESREVTLESMVALETEPVDTTKYTIAAREQVSGLSAFDALATFAGMLPLTDVEAALRDARVSLEQTTLSRLFPNATYASDGRRVASSQGSTGQPDDAEVMAAAVRAFDVRVSFCVQAVLLPALDVVASEHRYDLRSLAELCWEAPLVPPGHTDLWARGIWHGLRGDYPSAVSILVPQTEHALRAQLKAHGVHTLVVDEQTGVESEKGFGALLAMPESTALLGASMHFELRAMLTDQRSANLRNEIAHGLVHDGSAWSPAAIYAWWLCLRLAVMPVWNMRREATGNE